MRVALVVLGLCAVILPSCTVLNATIPAPLSSYPAPQGVPVAAQTNVSPYPLSQRLGRWNGTTFASVNPQSITGGNVVVLTHGWAAGLLHTYEQAQSASSELVTMWNPAMVDPKTGLAPITLFATLASSIQAADPSATVLMYSWVDQSATDTSALAASAPERATEVNGHRMATAIDQALATDFSSSGGQVHLIGHSFGANVATTAALALSSLPRQLSLFDSPEVNLTRIGGAKNDLPYKLTRLDVGRQPNQTFVDNYISLVGEPYAGYPGLGQVVDVHLKPPASDAAVDKHQYPIGWYANSATTKSSGVGLWWSPLMGATVTSLATTWNQPSSDPAQELQLVAEGVAPSSTDNASVSYVSTAIADPETALTVSAGGDTVANFDFTTDKDSLWLTFTTSVSGSPNDTFHLFIDGRERSTFAPPSDGTGSDGNFLILYDLESGTHTLSFVLESTTSSTPTTSPSSGQLANLRISSATDIQRNLTPTQTKRILIWVLVVVILAIVLLLAAFVLLLWWVIRRMRHRRHANRGELNTMTSTSSPQNSDA